PVFPGSSDPDRHSSGALVRGYRPLKDQRGAAGAPASQEGGCTAMRKSSQVWLPILLVCLATAVASAQSFRLQCPTSTLTHPNAANNNSEPAYPSATNVNGAIKCQQISGGDGYATMDDGTQTYLFSFGPLSGLTDIANGLPGTQFPSVFNTVYPGATPLQPGDPATSGVTYNGAVGLVPDVDANNGLGTGGPINGHVDPRPIMDVG